MKNTDEVECREAQLAQLHCIFPFFGPSFDNFFAFFLCKYSRNGQIRTPVAGLKSEGQKMAAVVMVVLI